jgi:aminoglycoside N3'-acetyltransferase
MVNSQKFMSTAAKAWRTAAKAQFYFVVRRVCSQRTRDALKRRLVTSRRRLSTAYLMIYGRYTAGELIQELKNRIPLDFDILMVHSSYDHLLPMYRGTVTELVDELLGFCGKNRTLAMPAFVLGGRLYDKKAYFSTRPFDVKRTPSEMGLVTEVFRRKPGVMRSLHPSHSICAIGPLAQELVATHHLVPTRTGKGTPFETMAQNRTAIVGLGVEYFRVLTQTHTAEDMLGDDFPIQFKKEPFPVVVVDQTRNKFLYNLTIPETSKQMDTTLLRSLLSEKELVEWKFHGTPLFATRAGVVTERLVDAARKGITVYGPGDLSKRSHFERSRSVSEGAEKQFR